MWCLLFFFSSRRRHTRLQGDWSSDVCSSDLGRGGGNSVEERHPLRHPPRRQCPGNKTEYPAEWAEDFTAKGAGQRADDEADERFEKFHPGLSEERSICRTRLSTIIATSGLKSNAPTSGTIRRIGSTIQSVRM